TLLANHGTQRLEEADASDDGRSLRARVRWTAHDGHDLLTEQRTLTTAVLPEAVGWSLHWHSTLEAGAEPLRITSPATRGWRRAGAQVSPTAHPARRSSFSVGTAGPGAASSSCRTRRPRGGWIRGSCVPPTTSASVRASPGTRPAASPAGSRSRSRCGW